MKHDYQTRKELKRLSEMRGSGTELITVYVPHDVPIDAQVGKLRDEYNQSGNIKSSSTRQNVQRAIDKIIQYLKTFKTIPDNGIAIFCGNISKEQAKPLIELFSVEPPEPLKSNIYRCDSSFVVEPIQKMFEMMDLYCLVIMDGRDATIGILRGSHFSVEKKLRSFAHAKVRKGGQSAARYERATSESINDYYKSVSEGVNEVYFKYNFKIKGLLVGGPGPMKENFVKAKHLNYQVKVIGIFDTGYVDEHMGVHELLEKAKYMLSEESAMQERKIVERFMIEIGNKGNAVYGYENVKRVLENNSIAVLIISEDVEFYRSLYRCSLCGKEVEKIEDGTAQLDLTHECGGKLDLQKKYDGIEELLNIAEKNNVDTIFISSDGQYGKQLLMGFHGIAALLKYKS